MIKFTVITVCRNAAASIEETIKSVIEQDYPKVEYLIIDGQSTDATPSILKKYKKQTTRIISEKDSGIYNAMNKGIRLATGDFVLFLNAGDRFHDVKVLSSVASKIEPETDIAYGDVVTFGANQPKQLVKFNRTSTYFLMNNTICHQAIFTGRPLLNPGFDEKYQIAADYNWLLGTLRRKNINQLYLDQVIAYYSLDGVSNSLQKRAVGEKEQREIARKYFGPWLYSFNQFISILRRLAYRTYLLIKLQK